MKKWTFFDQMLASFLVIVISSILSALLHPVESAGPMVPPPAGGILSPVRAAGPILNAGKHFGVFHIRKKFLEVNING